MLSATKNFASRACSSSRSILSRNAPRTCSLFVAASAMAVTVDIKVGAAGGRLERGGGKAPWQPRNASPRACGAALMQAEELTGRGAEPPPHPTMQQAPPPHACTNPHLTHAPCTAQEVAKGAPFLPRSGACAAPLPAGHPQAAVMIGGYVEKPDKTRYGTNEVWAYARGAGGEGGWSLVPTTGDAPGVSFGWG
jgi:hypothetical protein